jgi:hypothetical protein
VEPIRDANASSAARPDGQHVVSSANPSLTRASAEVEEKASGHIVLDAESSRAAAGSRSSERVAGAAAVALLLAESGITATA